MAADLCAPARNDSREEVRYRRKHPEGFLDYSREIRHSFHTRETDARWGSSNILNLLPKLLEDITMFGQAIDNMAQKGRSGIAAFIIGQCCSLITDRLCQPAFTKVKASRSTSP